MPVFLTALALLRKRARATYGIVTSAKKSEHPMNAIMLLDLRSVIDFSI